MSEQLRFRFVSGSTRTAYGFSGYCATRGVPRLSFSRGQAHDAARLPAVVAVQGKDLVGLATYRFAEGDCEVVTLDALHRMCGIGSALFARVVEEATTRACPRLWVPSQGLGK